MLENLGMDIEISSPISADPIFADMESVCASIAEKRPLDPTIARRVQDRSESLRRHLPETYVPQVAPAISASFHAGISGRRCPAKARAVR
jgi:hypothetical protein